MVVIANPVIGDGQVTIDVTATGGDTANSFFRRAGTNETPTAGATRVGDGSLTVTGLANRTMYELNAQTDDGAGNFSQASRVLFVTPRAAGATDFENIATEIRNRMLLVTNIGQVHTRRRHTKFWDELYARHKSNGRLNNWEVTRSARGQDLDAVDGSQTTEPFFNDTYIVSIQGHMAVQDAPLDADSSEVLFHQIVDGIADQIRLDNTLNNAVLKPRQLQVPTEDFIDFGGALCHFALMEYEAIVRVGG